MLGKEEDHNGFERLKRPKRYEVNYLPDIPEGQSEDSLEAERKLLVEEMKKTEPQWSCHRLRDGPDLPIAEKRDCRGRTSSENFEGAVARSERQVYPEFNREVTKNLQGDLFEALDRHTPRLVEIFRAKKGSVGQTLAGWCSKFMPG
ncbi:hypothetical protein D4764_17G0008140 [Takifugu flavidus]|uniref:Uncharacterized protein n=1 Tax=Takifugu flavidus TaxID=433684 RepID=A0A5C6NXI7_9TELE|nr:hypothetical protein D4764_17G0008140 [Takifugu flavidus]